ncbi:MAG: DegT/DnrJ/EryC1/StrS family aminotransferase [Thermodesulfovibrionales bacterium]|nr:DegT/DnrJ/EryC1/StrS family aminotransferase [Thermodesulfovibrionales bacterium]
MIPVCEPLVTEREIELVLDCLKTGWISSAGEYIDQFEKGWASYCKMPYGIAVSNGTTALQIAVRLLDLKPGEEVIMPAFTIISCAQAVTYCGGIPVLVDSDPRNWQMDFAQIESRVTPRTRAIMVVHIYGHPADMDPILAIAKKYGLMVIEDAAEAHGAEYKGQKCGGFGDISVFSFYANKLITTGEGGMVLTKNAELSERARSLRNLCFQKKQRFLHEELGYNFRLTNIQAALGVAQLERIKEIVDRKRAIARYYTKRFADIPGLEFPREEPWAKSVYWVYGVVLNENLGMDAAELALRLAGRGVETRPFFLGMHKQPVFQKMGLFLDEHYPNSERLARRGLYLPNGLAMEEQTIEQVCCAVRECLKEY